MQYEIYLQYNVLELLIPFCICININSIIYLFFLFLFNIFFFFLRNSFFAFSLSYFDIFFGVIHNTIIYVFYIIKHYSLTDSYIFISNAYYPVIYEDIYIYHNISFVKFLTLIT